MLIETHAHLDYPDFAADFDDVLRRATDAGVTRIITIGTSVESSRRAVELLVKAPVRASGYSTLVELLVRCQRAGLSVGEVSITFIDRVHGKSKMSSREMLDGARSVVTLGSALSREPSPAPARPVAARGPSNR